MNSAVELSFKVKFAETILAGPMNSARGPTEEKRRHTRNEQTRYPNSHLILIIGKKDLNARLFG